MMSLNDTSSSKALISNELSYWISLPLLWKTNVKEETRKPSQKVSLLYRYCYRVLSELNLIMREDNTTQFNNNALKSVLLSLKLWSPTAKAIKVITRNTIRGIVFNRITTSDTDITLWELTRPQKNNGTRGNAYNQ